MSTIDYDYFFALAQKHGFELQDYRGKGPPQSKEWKRREVEDIKGVVYHQTGGGDSISGLAKYHMGPNHISQDGLPGIAYTLFVNKPGEIYLCNDVEDVTWSQGDRSQPGDENKLFLSVCFGGKFYPWPGTRDDALADNPTPEQMARARQIWDFFKEGFHLTDLDLYGHYDFGKEACPGDVLADFIEECNDRVDHGLHNARGRQQALADLGYELGTVDGAWGKKSRLAMQAFQRATGLPITRNWTKLTAHQIYRELERREA